MMKKAILAVVAILLVVLLVVTMGRRDAPPAGDTAPRTGETGTSIQGTLTADSPDAPSRRGESPAADPGQAQPPASVLRTVQFVKQKRQGGGIRPAGDTDHQPLAARGPAVGRNCVLHEL